MTWPETIELPRAEDFCKGALHKGDGRRCSVGHEFAVFPGLSILQRRRFEKLWGEAADEVGIPKPAGSRSDDLVERTDHPHTSFDQLAQAFEGACLRVGYEIVEEE